MADCRVNERTLPNNALDQSVTFNTFGRYIRVLPALHRIQSNVRYNSRNGYAVILNWPAKTASIRTTWGYNPSDFAVTVHSETSFTFSWPNQPWGTATFVLQGNGNLLENGNSTWTPETPPGDGYLNISQVAVYDLNGTNMALGKPTMATSTPDWSPGPQVLVDGNMTPRGWGGATGGVWHSGDGNREGYWQVDLGSVQMVKNVRILARNDEWGTRRTPGSRIRVLQNTTDAIVVGTCLTSDAKAAADVAAIKAAADAAARAAAEAAARAAAEAAARDAARVAAEAAAKAASEAAAKAASEAAAKAAKPRTLINSLRSSAMTARNSANSTKLTTNIQKLASSILQLGGSKRKIRRKKRNSGRKTRRRR